MDKKTIPALKCIQNEKTFYISILDSETLKEICFVSRREDNQAEGFQRNLNKSRAKDIASYLDITKGCIPSALILSAQTGNNIQYDENKSLLSFELKKNSFMVLDGQHRLYGLYLAEKEYLIPVVIFTDLDIEDEVNLFVDINTNQKGVPSTLLLDIKKLTGNETTLEERQRILFDRLNENSVMAGLFSAATSKAGYVTRVTFNQATKDLFENGFFADKDSETIFKGVSNYLAAAEQVLIESKSTNAKITNSNFFKAIFAIFNECIDRTLTQFGTLKIENIKTILDPISRLNYDSYTGASNATYSKVLNDMRRELNEYDRKYRNFSSEGLFD